MKKNRLLTDALREIRRTLSRFLSLLLLSALAVAFLSGLRTTAPNMERTADNYFDTLGLMDMRVLSTLGLTDEDVSVLASQPGVAAAEGAYTADALLHLPDNDLSLTLLSLTEAGINMPELLEGRMPENSRECLAEPKLLSAAGLKIGDPITFDTGEGSFEDALHHETYTIVGTANSPLYISIERGSSSLGAGQVTAFVLIPRSAFAMEAYTDAYLLVDGAAELVCYSDDYDDWMDRLEAQLEPLSDQRAGLRYDSVVTRANEKLDDAQQEFDDAKAETEQKLADARKELGDARRELDDGWAEYRNGEDTLARETADAKRKIADAQRELPAAKQKLDDGEAEYLDGVQELADGQKEYNDGLQTWQNGKKEYEENEQKLADGQREYNDGRKEYQNGLAALIIGSKDLDAARIQLDAARESLDSGSASLQAGRDRLHAAQQQYDQLKQLYDGVLTPAFAPENLSGLLLGISTGDENASGMVLALRSALVAVQAQLPADSAAYGQLTQLLAGIPEDAAQLAQMAATMPEVLSGTLLGGMQVLAQSLPQMAGQLSAAQSQLNSGAAALAEGYAQYYKGWEQYDNALEEFNDAVVQLQEAYAQLEDAEAELADGKRQLAEAKQELDDGWLELEDARIQLEDGKQELLDARQKLDDGWREYNDGVARLADAQRKLPEETAKARRELSDALVELNDGESDYKNGLREYEDGKREADEELSKARKTLNDARRDIAEIEDCNWYVLGRSTNIGYVSYQQDAQRMGNLASVFPLIFFLVAALVCLTTMTRMVEEQRVQIGGLKALGYGRGAIALKYVGYGFLASFLGGVGGLALGCTLIPWVIFNAWKILYTVGDLTIYFDPLTSLLCVGAAVLCVTGTAFWTASTALRAVPAALMRPRTPKPGKRVILERIKPLWNRMSFTWKVTMRNLFRYKKRFWMTVAGIGGCTALIITGFGLRNSIYDVLDKQFDEISTYSAQIRLADDVTEDEMQEISQTLDADANVRDWLASRANSLTVQTEQRSMDAIVFTAVDIASFGNFIHLRHRLDDDTVALPQEGAVVTEKLAKMLGVTVGDIITLDGDERVDVTVADITENYVQHYVYLSASAYEAIYGQTPTVNTILAQYTDEEAATADEVSSRLIALSGVGSVSRIRETRDTFTKSMESVDYAVIVVIVSAAALAFVVLYNLTNINITERMRELATLKVLGFYDGELSSYIYRENVFLTLFGIGFGLVMGKFLHQWLVLTVEIDMVMFGRTIRPASYLYAVGLTLLFSFLVNLAAHHRLRKIDMVESLKTVE